MKKKYNLAVYIGRFQPFTKGHINIVNQAKDIADHVVMAIGSANKPRSMKNPFSYEERCKIINEVMEYDPQLLFCPVNDYNSDSEWVESIFKTVTRISNYIGINTTDINITLIGMDKDESSYYLKYFPFWDYVEFKKPEHIISATDVRNIMFGKSEEKYDEYIHDKTIEFVNEFILTEEYSKIMKGEN